jgi:glutamyl-tRNA reductase
MKKRKNRPLFFIDIAVPRDIDPGVNDLENIYLYDIDDLKELSQAHMSNRIQESEKAQAIIEDEVAKFNGWLKQLELNPLIAQIQEYLEAMRNSELHRTCQKLKNADPETLRQIDLLTKSIINKIIHPHMMMLKKNDSTAVLDIIKDLLLPREENENKMDRGDTGEQAGPQADRDCNQSPPDTLP